MKKILLSLFALCATSSLWAFQSGLLSYNILAGDSTVEVTFQVSHSDSNHRIAGQNYTTLNAVTIPETVTYNSKTYTVVAIGKQAFARKPSSYSAEPLHDQNNNTLSLINIPKTIKTIGDYAFYRCTALTTINFLGDGLTTIGAYAFYGTSSLSKIVFPETLKTIGAYAFLNSDPNASGIRGLKDTLVIPNTVKGIGKYAFSYLNGLTSVTIGNSVSAIDESAFLSCNSLTSVTLGNSVVTIGTSAFESCTNLTSITLPKSVKTIQSNAFASCSKLTKVYLKPTTPPAFTSTNILPSTAKTFYVPCGASETYFLSDWIAFTTNFQEECDKKYTIYVNQDCTSSVVEE